MESPASAPRSDPSKESLKLKISTNHADGTSKIVTNRGGTPPTLKPNHAAPAKDRDGSHRAGTNKDGGGGGGGGGGGHRDGSKHKHEHKSSSSSKDPQRSSSSSSDKHKSSSGSSSSKPNSSSSSSKESKPTSNGDRPKDGKSSSSSGDKHKSSNHSSSNNHSSSSSKPSSSSTKPKDGSSSKSSSSGGKDGSSHHKSSSSSSSSSKPREGSSSVEKKSSSSSSSSSKPKEGSSSGMNNSMGSPPPSSKPKSLGSSDHHKSSSSSSGSSRPKDGSSSASKTPSSSGSSKPTSSSSSSRPPDKKPSSSSVSPEKKSSSSSTPKVNDEKSRNKENHESHSSHKADKPKDGSSSKPKDKPKDGRDDKTKIDVKIKQEVKDKESGSSSKPKPNATSSSSSTKVKSELNGRVPSHESKSVKVKAEPLSDDDTALADRKLNSSSSQAVKKEIKAEKRPAYDEDSEDEPLLTKLGKKAKNDDNKRTIAQKKRKSYAESSSEDEPVAKKLKKVDAKSKAKKPGGAKIVEAHTTASPVKRKKGGAEEPEEVWKWWEEEKKSDGSKWKTLEHKGPVFAPDYDPLPPKVKFLYNGKEVRLSENAEEVATFYARMLDHDYTSKEAFNKNFMKDWRKMMTDGERDMITDLKKCDFKQMHQFFVKQSEERKNRTKEEKKKLKDENDQMQKEYGFCLIDGHKEKIGNFKIEPPGLFRGRGEHPKMGKLKRRTMPEDVIINCSKGSKVPEPPAGHKWKEVRHDNAVSWLASWQENVQGQIKYVMLNPSSKLKGQKDMEKYEVARRLKLRVDSIRDEYRQDWRSKEMRLRQRAVALYFIDRLALRAGNEKDSDETADTVGCCSLRVEHITLHDKLDGKENVIIFDFLGKDSIRYLNSVAVEKRVYKNVQLFMQGKQPQDDLFDRLNTSTLNKYLNDLMEGLTAKVFRTFNASKTLQEKLREFTKPKDSVAAKILAYNRANREVALLCNHQRAVPKTFDKSMENMNVKIKAKQAQVSEAKKDLKGAKGNRSLHEKKEKALERLKEQLDRLEMQATDKEENKQVALGTSKLNYLDPRISVAWCKKYEVPIEKIYNRTQRDKFRWAIEMAGPEFEF